MRKLSSDDLPAGRSRAASKTTAKSAETGRRYQIGAVAARTDLSHQTLRHWDEVGLVSPSLRSEGGFRLYSESDIERLLVIRRMKPLEFTLTEMRQLLEALDVLNSPRRSRKARESAAAFVAECHEQAEKSIERLRKQLAYAEELTEILAAQSEAAEEALSSADKPTI